MTEDLFKIVDMIFLSTEHDARKEKLLGDHFITSILNCDKNAKSTKSPGRNYMHLKIGDGTEDRIQDFFKKAHEFMDLVVLENKPKTGILVHCSSGKSRSVSIVISYLMTRPGLAEGFGNRTLTLKEAYDHVAKNRKTKLNVNFGFMKRLCVFEKELTGENTIDYRTFRNKFVLDYCNDLIRGSTTLDDVEKALDPIKEENFMDNNKVVNVDEYLEKVREVSTKLRNDALKKMGK